VLKLLHGVLAYFYGHREEIMERLAKADELAKKLSGHNRAKHEEWKRILAENKAQDNQE
jgi:hypothetical protein